MNMPSKRSNTPPWPGNILPESLMPKLRLNNDSTKSPNEPKITTITAIAIQVGVSSPSKIWEFR